MKKQEEHNYVYKFKKFVSKIHQKLLRLEKRDLLQVIFFYSLNFFSLEFHLSLFYLFWCLLFFCSYSWSYWRNFSCYFFLSCQFSHFFVCFFAKEESSQFLFFHFFVKKKERKKTMDLFFTFLLMIPSCKLCFDEFFFFVCSFVCLFVWFVVTPEKQ